MDVLLITKDVNYGVFLFFCRDRTCTSRKAANKKGGKVKMELQYQIKEDRMVVPMPKEVDHHVAKSLSREIDFLVDSWHVKTLVFDFEGTDFMDSSGIGVLLGRKKTMELYSGEMRAVNLGERVEKIFEKSGLFRIITVERSGKGEKENGNM